MPPKVAEAKEVLDIMRLSKESQYGYNRYLDYLHLKASEALSLKVEAEEKVRQQRNMEIAKSLLQTTLSDEDIAKHTQLSIEQVKKLRAAHD